MRLRKGGRSEMDQNNEILGELRRITKLLSLIATKNQEQKEQIKVLSGIGFQPKEIAGMLHVTANVVRVTLSRIRKEDKGSKVKKTKERKSSGETKVRQ